MLQLYVAIMSLVYSVTDRDEEGQGLAEYALILSFIAIVAIAALAFFGVQLSSVLTDPVGRDISSVADLIGP